MYLFSIPDSEIVGVVNRVMLDTYNTHREWFYDDFSIETAYGCPIAGCIWNGNRANGKVQYIAPGDWERNVLMFYSSYKISYRILFTNFMLEPVHLSDTYANALAKIVNRWGGDAMVSTSLMANYLETNYPEIRISWSTTTDFGRTVEEQIETINSLSATNLVVLPYQFNNTPYLDKFTHPENLEVMINEKCVDNCPYRREHWGFYNRFNLFREQGEFDCRCDTSVPKKHTIEREQLQYYYDLGFRRFKIEGRQNNKKLAEAYNYYFIRPEYCETAEKMTAEVVERYRKNK